ncbi:hypothetical protein [Pantoea dispersa]|nr:hypothetical protein [Pantoea dispersa]
MDDFNLDHLGDLEAAEQKAKEAAERQPDIDEGEADCEGCKI